MRNRMLAAVAALALIGLSVALTQAQGRGAAPVVPKLATDKTMFWPAADIEARWKENEALKRNNSRLFDGPTNISANVRIVAGEDPPLVHETTADLWIVTAGTAVARTDGKLVDSGGKSAIVNPMMRTVRTGDVLYVAARRASPLHGDEGLQGVADALRHGGAGANRSTCGCGRTGTRRRSRRVTGTRSWRPTRRCSGRRPTSTRAGRKTRR